MTQRRLAVTAATVFAVSTFAVAAQARVPCSGANACKEQNAEGQGFVNAGSSFECTVIKSR